jgi:hypothetical protein
MKRRLVLIGFGAVLGLLPVVPGGPVGASAARSAPAVFAASAEAWAYSAEIGVPGPLGPLASHTTATIDNSPHAQGASGLADPGFLIRAAAQLVAGVPTPAYCESAWPEGPDQADCGVPDGPVAVSGTASGAGPEATATAALGKVAVGEGAPALTVAAQSTTSSASFASDGALHARADVTLSGIAVAGGALRIGTLTVHRDAVATGLPGGAQTSTAVELAGAAVGGTPVPSGADPVRSLADAARKAFGDTIAVEALGGREETTPDGKLVADSSGLQITWRPQPDRSVRIVLGYGRVLVYATPPASPVDDVATPAVDLPLPGSGPTGAASDAADAVVAVTDQQSSLPPAGGAPHRPAAPSGITASLPPLGDAGPSSGSVATPVETAAPPALVPINGPLVSAGRAPVRWVSPFLVLAQMTTGVQAWWFLLAVAPLALAAWLSHRSGLGILAPWAAAGAAQRGEP